MGIRPEIVAAQQDFVSWRHHLHRHPELSYDTVETAQFVRSLLSGFGCDEVVGGIGQTGVVGLIHGRLAGKVVGLRADMDALPIQEKDMSRPHASTIPGRMHACGHDGHMAMLLGAASHLAATRNFAGTVALIFQPAEERGAGARAMVEDGLFQRFGISEVYGMHNAPGLPVGQFSIRPGPFYASTDAFMIEVEGRGGHAAKPHRAHDPLTAAANLILALQTIVSRRVDPVQPAVVSVTMLQADGDALNVIPTSVRLGGTVRCFDAEVRKLIREEMDTIASGLAIAHHVRVGLDWRPGYPALVNWPDETAEAVQAARRFAAHVDDNAPAIMWGEDFAFMLEACRGAYIQTGNGDSAEVHSGDYDFDDSALPWGAEFWVSLIEQRLALA